MVTFPSGDVWLCCYRVGPVWVWSARLQRGGVEVREHGREDTAERAREAAEAAVPRVLARMDARPGDAAVVQAAERFERADTGFSLEGTLESVRERTTELVEAEGGVLAAVRARRGVSP